MDPDTTTNENNSDTRSAEQERLHVQKFVQSLKTRWEKTYYNNKEDNRELSLATFPFSPAERQSLRHAQRQGLLEGTFAGLAALAFLRLGPKLLLTMLAKRKRFSLGSQNNFQSPFVDQKKSVPLTTTNNLSPQHRWMDAGFLLVDVGLSFGIAMTVSTQFAGAGDPTLEAIVSMPGLTELPEQNQQQHSPSVLIHQVCPLAIDLYQEMTTPSAEDNHHHKKNDHQDTNQSHRRQETPILAQKPPQTYHLDALQRFVRNCQRRQRVEQTTAWQGRTRNVVSN